MSSPVTRWKWTGISDHTSSGGVRSAELTVPGANLRGGRRKGCERNPHSIKPPGQSVHHPRCVLGQSCSYFNVR